MVNSRIKITGIDEVGRGAIAGPILSTSFTGNYLYLGQLLKQISNLDYTNLSDSLPSVALAKGGSVNQTTRLKRLIEYDLGQFRKVFPNNKNVEEISSFPEDKDVLNILNTLKILDDSKKVTKLNRDKLYKVLTQIGEYKLGIVGSEEIDKFGLQKANLKSMLNTVPATLSSQHLILTDHVDISIETEKYPLFESSSTKYVSIDKGDSESFCIAAASVIAKVSRDKIMHKYHHEYPLYGFDQHVGYGTKQHLQAIQKYGPCKIHRLSYKLFQDAKN